MSIHANVNQTLLPMPFPLRNFLTKKNYFSNAMDKGIFLEKLANFEPFFSFQKLFKKSTDFLEYPS